MGNALRNGLDIAILSRTKDSAKGCMSFFFNEPDSVSDGDKYLIYHYNNNDNVYWVPLDSTGCMRRHHILFYDSGEINEE